MDELKLLERIQFVEMLLDQGGDDDEMDALRYELIELEAELETVNG
jgi:hypothetical protein